MDKAKFLTWWPVLVTLTASVLAFGAVRSDVSNQQQRIEQLEQGSPALQERVTRIEERQKTLQEDVREIKDDIKEIAKAVK